MIVFKAGAIAFNNGDNAAADAFLKVFNDDFNIDRLAFTSLEYRERFLKPSTMARRNLFIKV